MVMAEFIFHSEGKMLFGMPYVAKLHINDYYEIEKEFMLCNPVIDKDGDITVDIEYSAENFDIIEERHGSCNQSISATYNLIYRKKIIQLGQTDDKDLEELIKKFLIKKISVCELLSGVDEVIKEQYEEDLDEIFGIYDKEIGINIGDTIEQFIKDNELIQVRFNDFHMIFTSEVEKILMNFRNDDNIYIETQSMKLNITLSKIKTHETLTDNKKIDMIILDMNDGANITLISQ